MKATSIPAHEQSFITTGIDGQGKKFDLKINTVAIPGSTDRVKIVSCVRQNKDDSFYVKEKFPKQRIVLHFTAGYLKGDIAKLSEPGNHVSVAYVIGRGGAIYQLWDDAWWSFHLGKGSSGGNTEMSKQSVGIELSNIGWLKKIGTNLVTSYSDRDVYCRTDETGFYTKLPTPYRGQSYYATFTEAQYTSLSKLLQLLLAKYPAIGRSFLPEPLRYEHLARPEKHTCIMSHVNFRATGKWDLGPAFRWDKVVL
jgi:N-acetylmuramoyl-L-alanine amidase